MKIQKLVIRVPNWLGDTMMATPAVSAVREMFPRAHVAVLAKASFAGFWKSFPGVDEVVTVEKGLAGFLKTTAVLKLKKFDAALILPSSFSSAFLVFAAEIPVRIGWGSEGRSLFLTDIVTHPRPRKKHLVWEYLELAVKGFSKPPRSKVFKLLSPVGLDAKREADKLLKNAGVPLKNRLVALGPGATYGPAKRWPLPYWHELIERFLMERRETLLILGGKEEAEYLKGLLEGLSLGHPARIHSLVGKTTPSTLAAVLEKCEVLVTNDTGPMHVAAAVGTPTVALFGSTSPVWTRPFGQGHEVIYKHAECSPCFQKTCPIGYICLHQIKVDEVYQAVQRKLKKPQKITAEAQPKHF